MEIFKGTLSQVLAQAAAGNTKDKLPMPPGAKSEAAWRLTIGTAPKEITAAEIAESAGVSKRTVESMRATMKKLKEQNPRIKLDSLTWWDAQSRESAEAIGSAEWEDKLTAEWAERLQETFAMKLAAQVLERYSPTLATPCRLLARNGRWGTYP